MTHDGRFTTRDGLSLFERRWDAAAARGHVVLIHGYGEYCGRYEHVAAAFNAAGLTVHAFDQRGYGLSPGKRGYVGEFDAFLRDLDDYLEHIQGQLDGAPWFLMGHSMGGLVLARYVETRTVAARGLVFSSPFLAFNDDVPPALLALAGVLSVVTPWLPVGRVENTGLSRDPAIVEQADNDPLSYHGRVAARTGAQFHKAITEARAAFPTISAPLYAIHGEKDSIVSNEGTRALYARCASADKQLTIYEGGYHELWNDLEKDAVIRGISDWMTARL